MHSSVSLGHIRCSTFRVACRSRLFFLAFVAGVLLNAVLLTMARNAPAQDFQWQTRPLPAYIAQSRVDFLRVDPGGYVWFVLSEPETGRGSMLAVLDAMDAYLFPFAAAQIGAVTTLAFESITDEPDNGAIWIGGDSGVLVVDRRGRTTALTSGNSPLPLGSVRTIYCGRDNTKWIAVSGKGVSCVDAAFNWASYNRDGGLGSDDIDAILEDNQGNLWFGTHDQGVSRLDREGVWMSFTSSNSALIGNRVIRIVEEKPGRLWFLTPDGISVFDGLNWTSYGGRNSPLGRSQATSLAIDRDGNKWIGTDGSGLLKLDGFGRWTEYTTANTRLPDNRIASLTIDDRAALWLATPAGITSMSSGMRAPVGAQELYTSGTSGSAVVYPFEQALLWEATGDTDGAELSWSLPSFPFGGRAWYYGALWTDPGAGFDYEVRTERTGAQRMLLNGDFSRAILCMQGAVLPGNSAETPGTRTSPFPNQLPQDVAAYVLPGEHIPAQDPEVVQLAAALVRPESRSDMYATVSDIVYSDRIQQLQLEPSSDAAGAAADVAAVLRSKSGDQHAKARVVCTLVRAAGVPARLVMDMDGAVWCQAWIARRGWIPIESTYTVFDYIRPMRTGLPKILVPREYAVAELSGRDDTLSRLSWNTAVSARVHSVPGAELQKPDRLRTARMLLATIHEDDSVPQQAKIPLADGIVVYGRQRGADVQLVFEDSDGSELHTLTPVLDGPSSTVNVRDRLLWRFIARRLGSLLVLENIDCKEYLSDSSE